MSTEYCFISYSNGDAGEFGPKIALELEGGYPFIETWFDKRDILPGNTWDQKVPEAIKTCKCLLFVMTKDSIAEKSICSYEWDLALRYKKPILFLRLHADIEPPFRLGKRQWIDLSSNFKAGMARLRQAILRLDSHEGQLEVLKDRLADANRDLNRALTKEDKLPIEKDIEELTAQIQTQEKIAANPQAAQEQTRKNIEAGLERERHPEKPAEPIFSTIPPQPYFFGRAEELKSIADAIEPEARTWGALIDGPGGIGKTALAIKAGHEASSQQFPLKLFLSAKVRELTTEGEQPLTDSMIKGFMDLLKELARELGEKGIERVNSDEWAKIIRSALAGHRALLVIDNVETFSRDERVRLYQFLSRLPVCCKAIVTGRRRSDIDARIIRLDRLAEKEALEFLAELARNNWYLHRADKAERVQLYEHTNGNPLLIRWVVGQLGRAGSQCRSIAEACAFLDKAPVGNDPLEYVFGDLLDTFTDNESAVLAALTHFNGPAKLEWLAEMTGLAHPAALTALEDLAVRALLIADPEDKTFFLPHYAGTYLRRKHPKAVEQTGERLTQQAYAFAMENGHQNYDKFKLLEAAWPKLAASFSFLLQGENKLLQGVCRSLIYFLQFSGRWDEAIKLAEQAENKSLIERDFHEAGWRAYHASWIHYHCGDAGQLSDAAKRCEAHWRHSGFEAVQQAKVLRLHGWSLLLQKDYPAVEAAFAESLRLSRSLTPDSRDVSMALNDLAIVERLKGDLTSAENHLHEALRIDRKTKDSEAIAVNIGGLAELALVRKDWPEAEYLTREALQGSETIGRKDQIAINCGRLAQALAQQNRHEEGLPLAQRAVDILTRLRMPIELEQARAALWACDVAAPIAT